MTSVSQRNPNKRQVVGKLHAARASSRSKKAGGGFVSITSTMTNLVLVAFMLLLAFAPTSCLAESTNDALEIGDTTNAILEQSKYHGKSDSIMFGVEMITSPPAFCWASIVPMTSTSYQ
eukprot:scaffold10182_cov144-Chaetoceros_neogracile.AAC.1